MSHPRIDHTVNFLLSLQSALFAVHSFSKPARTTLRKALGAALLLFVGMSGTAQGQEGVFYYVPQSLSDEVRIYRANADGTLAAVTNVTVGDAPVYAAIRGDQAFVYVTNNGDDSVSVIDTSSNAVIQTIPTGNAPFGVAVSPDGKLLYVANNVSSNSVSVFSVDTLTGQLTALAPIATGAGSNPRHVVFSPDGSRAYIANQGNMGANGSISIVNTATHAIVGTVATGSQLIALAINPAGTRVYAASSANVVFVIDTASETVIASPATGGNTLGLSASRDGAYYYATSNNDFDIRQYNAATNTQVGAPLPTGGFNPRGFSFSPDGKYVYIPQQGTSDNIAIFSVAPGTGVLTAYSTIAAANDPALVVPCGNGNAMLATGATFVANTAGALGCTGSSAQFTGGTLLVNDAGLAFTTPITLGAGGGTIDTNGNDATVSSVISGAGVLNKNGTGTLTLSGTNTVSGVVVVNNGTLLVNGSLATSITVASGATLGGSGTINGDVTLLPGATLSPNLTIVGTVSDLSIVTPEPQTPTIAIVDGLRRNAEISGPAEITENGVIDGGRLIGSITSKGLVTGTVVLGPDTRISGGRISGDIRGTPGSPGWLKAHILAGTRLENVIIGAGSNIDPGIVPGPNTRFEDLSAIPANLDLGGALGFLRWDSGDGRRIPNLAGTLIAAVNGGTPNTLLADLQLLNAHASAGVQVTQNADGELILATGDSRSVLLPIRVYQAAALGVAGIRFSPAGIGVSDDGAILFTTDWQTVVALPLLVNAEVFGAALGKLELGFDYDGNANLFVRSLHPARSDRYVARAGLASVPAAGSAHEGLRVSPQPGLANVSALALVFIDRESEEPMAQELVPVPADWLALKEGLLNISGVSAASIGADGVISVKYDGELIQALADYRVIDRAVTGTGALVLQPAGDINGDGTHDFSVIYANGDVQALYRYPPL